MQRCVVQLQGLVSRESGFFLTSWNINFPFSFGLKLFLAFMGWLGCWACFANLWEKKVMPTQWSSLACLLADVFVVLKGMRGDCQTKVRDFALFPSQQKIGVFGKDFQWRLSPSGCPQPTTHHPQSIIHPPTHPTLDIVKQRCHKNQNYHNHNIYHQYDHPSANPSNTAKSQNAKTFRIARFLSQKLSG